MFPVCYLFIICAGAADMPGGAEAVFAQMLASDARIQTAEFEFEIIDKGNGAREQPDPPRVKSWTGTLWFRHPLEVRVRFQEGTSQSGEFAANKEVSKGFSTDSKTGFSEGLIETGGPSAFAKIPGLAALIMRPQFDEWKKRLPIEKWTATQSGKLIRMTGRGGNSADAPQHQWEIDPQRGFALLKIETRLNTKLGIIDVIDSIEVTEAAPGIWFPQIAVRQQKMGGKVTRESHRAVVPGSLKINQPLPDQIFELRFPSGTRVDDQNQQKSYIQGGGNSQSREKVAKLAAEAKEYVREHPIEVPGTAVPTAGALSTTPSGSTWGWGRLSVVGITGLSIGGVVFLLWRQRRP